MEFHYPLPKLVQEATQTSTQFRKLKELTTHIEDDIPKGHYILIFDTSPVRALGEVAKLLSEVAELNEIKKSLSHQSKEKNPPF